MLSALRQAAQLAAQFITSLANGANDLATGAEHASGKESSQAMDRPALQYFRAIEKSTRLPSEIVLQVLDAAEIWTTIFDPQMNTSEFRLRVGNDNVPSATTSPLTRWGAENSRRMTFHMVSRDQGWSSEARHLQGTYEGSYTWHEAVVTMPNPSGDEEVVLYKQELQRNLHARAEFQEYTVVLSHGHEIFSYLRPGCVVKIVSCAMYPGWVNHVKFTSIEMQFYDTCQEDLPTAFEGQFEVLTAADESGA